MDAFRKRRSPRSRADVPPGCHEGFVQTPLSNRVQQLQQDCHERQRAFQSLKDPDYHNQGPRLAPDAPPCTLAL